MSNTYSECVSLALGIQCAKRLRRIILSSLAVPYISSLYHKSYDIPKKKVIEQKKCLILFTTFV